jgi:hypothetical protein
MMKITVAGTETRKTVEAIERIDTRIRRLLLGVLVLPQGPQASLTITMP